MLQQNKISPVDFEYIILYSDTRLRFPGAHVAKNYSEALRCVRNACGLSVRQFAAELEMPFTSYSNFESRYRQRPFPQEFTDRVLEVLRRLGVGEHLEQAVRTGSPELARRRSRVDRNNSTRDDRKRASLAEINVQIKIRKIVPATSVDEQRVEFYYTDKRIIDRILQSLAPASSPEVQLDPSAGSGHFLVSLIKASPSSDQPEETYDAKSIVAPFGAGPLSAEELARHLTPDSLSSARVIASARYLKPR